MSFFMINFLSVFITFYFALLIYGICRKSRRKTKIAPVPKYRDEQKSVLPLCFTVFLQIQPHGAPTCPCDVTVAPVVTYTPVWASARSSRDVFQPKPLPSRTYRRLSARAFWSTSSRSTLFFLHMIPHRFAFVNSFSAFFCRKFILCAS